MKRIKSAMLQQTLKFVLSDKLSHNEAVLASEKEAEDYVKGLERTGAKFKILRQWKDEDGASVVEVKKQYNTAPVGDYI